MHHLLLPRKSDFCGAFIKKCGKSGILLKKGVSVLATGVSFLNPESSGLRRDRSVLNPDEPVLKPESSVLRREPSVLNPSPSFLKTGRSVLAPWRAGWSRTGNQEATDECGSCKFAARMGTV